LETVRIAREPELAVRAFGIKTNPSTLTDDFHVQVEEDDNPIDAAMDSQDLGEPGPAPAFEPTKKHILVADLGGGTFDVTIVRHLVESDEIHVLNTCGDEKLGGDDFDEAIAMWVANSMKNRLKTSGHWPLTGEQKRRLRALSRQAKERLSSCEATEIEFAGGKMKLTRELFNQLSAKLLRTLVEPIREAAYSSGLRLPFESLTPVGVEGKQPGECKRIILSEAYKRGMIDETPEAPLIDTVLCVGAACWNPAVRDVLEMCTGCKPLVTLVDPETAVVIGAAVLAATLERRVNDHQVYSPWRVAWGSYLLEKMKQKEEEELAEAMADEEKEKALTGGAVPAMNAVEP